MRMKIETFKKAVELQTSITSLKKIIKEVEEEHHWITIVSAKHKEECFCDDFRKRLLVFAKSVLHDYEIEFDELEE